MHRLPAPALAKGLKQPRAVGRHQELLEAQRKHLQLPDLPDRERIEQANVGAGGAHERLGKGFREVLERVDGGLALAHLVEEDEIALDVDVGVDVQLEVREDRPGVEAVREQPTEPGSRRKSNRWTRRNSCGPKIRSISQVLPT